MKLKKAKLLKEATVKRMLRDIWLAEIAEDKRHAEERDALRTARYEVQRRCPHTKTHIESGDYMPCREVCDICGLELP